MHLEVFQIFKVMLDPSPTTPRHWIKLAETYCNSFPEPNHSIWKDTIPNGQSSFLVWSTMLVSRRLTNPLLQRKIAELEDTSGLFVFSGRSEVPQFPKHTHESMNLKLSYFGKCEHPHKSTIRQGLWQHRWGLFGSFLLVSAIGAGAGEGQTEGWYRNVLIIGVPVFIQRKCYSIMSHLGSSYHICYLVVFLTLFLFLVWSYSLSLSHLFYLL